VTPPADPLQGLRDIHLPDPVSLWPLAPGWWAVLALALLALAAGTLLWRRHRAGVARAARRELDAIAREFGGRPDVPALARQLSSLVRRVTLVRDQGSEAAGLHGSRRAAALAQGRRPLPERTLLAMETALYGGDAGVAPPAAAEAWIDDVRRWIGRKP